jgi:predicted transglutaminase-like cysteine proteinase
VRLCKEKRLNGFIKSMTHIKANSSLLASLQAHLNRNRLGELLVANGLITEAQLRGALNVQQSTGLTLGSVLKKQGLVTGASLKATLLQQIAWRGLAASLAFVIGFSALGTYSSRAAAEPTHTASVQTVSLNRSAPVQTVRSYEPLFGASETRSADVSPFKKWTNLMARLNPSTAPLPDALAMYANAADDTKIKAVNSYYNKVRYVEDKNNFGMSDYWSTPTELVTRGGDCEDFAIAKYTALKALGFSEDQLRLAIVQDTWKGIPHAILIVYTKDGAAFLDNQYTEVKQVLGFERYKPVYSINRTGWWRHIS